MRLSTAIRKGSLQHPQCFDSFTERDEAGAVIASCAAAAAYEGVYGEALPEQLQGQLEVARALVSAGVTIPHSRACPECGEPCRPVFGSEEMGLGLVFHLNDAHHWSRERIAEFLDFLELETPR